MATCSKLQRIHSTFLVDCIVPLWFTRLISDHALDNQTLAKPVATLLTYQITILNNSLAILPQYIFWIHCYCCSKVYFCTAFLVTYHTFEQKYDSITNNCLLKRSTKKPVTTMLTYPWKCTVLHCKHLGNTWKPLVLMTPHFDYCPNASEDDNQSGRSSAPVVSRCFPGGYNVKLYISRGRLAWWLLAFLHSVKVTTHALPY